MLRTLGITGLALASALVLFGPAASAQDRYYRRRSVERREWRAHERWEHRYRGGYYDRYGYWHPYRY
ncbi:MAG TPA: hypothetical protein VKG25_22195 [Bryobacteraceae bacterium]|nr:hypothetical protein [Bryobacteraceae bacterium]